MHRFSALFAAIAFIVGGGAFAQGPQTAAHDALAEAEADPNLRFSYTMTFETPGSEAVVSRFDADNKTWTTLSGDPKALPSKAAQKFKNVKKSESVPGGLLYADFRKYLNDITYAETVDNQHVFAFVPPEAKGQEVGEELDALMKARLYVDAEDGHLARYEVRALKPFKPLPVVKLEEFAVVLDYERLSPDGPAVLVKLYSRTKGKRALRKVDTEFTATFSDFVPR